MQVNEHASVRAFWGGRVEPIQTQAAMVWESWQRLGVSGLGNNAVLTMPRTITPEPTMTANARTPGRGWRATGRGDPCPHLTTPPVCAAARSVS